MKSNEIRGYFNLFYSNSSYDLVLDGTNGPDLLLGSAGKDKISGKDGPDSIEGGAGSDTLDGGAGHDTLSYSNSSAGVVVHLASGRGYYGDAEGDRFKNFESIIGSQFDDGLIGTEDNNLMLGRGGNDLMYGYAGDNVLIGGEGDDSIYSGKDSDNIFGDEGIDTVLYTFSTSGVSVSLANNTASGGYASRDELFGIENIVGSAYDDILEGDDGANRLAGGAGDDQLSGGRGNDVLEGQDGDDFITGDEGADRLDGGAGRDVLNYFFSTQAITINLASGKGSGGYAAGDRVSNFEVVYGSTFGDRLIGDASGNQLYGFGGDDMIYGHGGADSLNGHSGDDHIFGGKGNDIITGGEGADALDGGDGTDTLSYMFSCVGVTVDLQTNTASGGEAEDDTISHFENIIASYHDDHLTGDDTDNLIDGIAGDDWIYGGGGNDILIGGGGIDRLYGGTGSDQFVLMPIEIYENFGGFSHIMDFEDGVDKIALHNSLSFAELSITSTSEHIEISHEATGLLLGFIENGAEVVLTQDDFVTLELI